MRFVVKNDVFYVLFKKIFLILIYLVCLLLVSFFIKNDIVSDISKVKGLLGIWVIEDSNIVVKIFIVYSFLVYIYLGYDLFFKDIRFSYGNIFSRINKNDWMLLKTVSVFLITIVIKVITYLMTYIVFRVSCNFNSYIINILFTCFWQMMFLIGYIICFKVKKRSGVVFGIALFIGLLASFPVFLMSDFYNIIVLIVLDVLLFFSCLRIGSKSINYISERND